ncbi:putative reverse transcriptase domain-containing protein, partial [Tanacetum coccineum]
MLHDIAAIIEQQLQTILPQIVAQVTNNVNNANNGNGGNGGGGNGNGGNNGCTFKAFQSYNPKEYDGKGGMIVLTRWIEKMENMIDNSGCAENQKVRYAASTLVNKALTWWNTQVQARGREAAMAMTWNDFKALMVEKFCPSNEMEKLENDFILSIIGIIQAARDRQKSYADVRCKPLEFQEGDRVMLKVSPWKGVFRFGKRGKLNPRYIGPFKVLAKVGTVAYRLELSQQLSKVHSMFHLSNLKKCLSDEPLAIPLDEIHIDDKLYFIEEPAEIMDREVKWLKQSRIPII